MFTWKTVEVDSPVTESTPPKALVTPPSIAALTDLNPRSSSAEPTIITRGLIIRGEITSKEPLFIQGRVEGSILMDECRVTVSSGGIVDANIMAREIVVLGEVRGSLSASYRVEIRSSAALTCNVTAPRVSIEDGAVFMGDIDTRMPENGVELKAVRVVQVADAPKRANHRGISPRPVKSRTNNGPVPLQR